MQGRFFVFLHYNSRIIVLLNYRQSGTFLCVLSTIPNRHQRQSTSSAAPVALSFRVDCCAASAAHAMSEIGRGQAHRNLVAGWGSMPTCQPNEVN